MSNSADERSANNRPLFQEIDKKEHAAAPAQVANTNIPPEELDIGGTAASDTGVAASEAQLAAAAGQPHGPRVAGAGGGQQTTPVVAVRPDISAATPVMLPASTDVVGQDEDATDSTRPL